MINQTDAYALKRALVSMEIPVGLPISPLLEAFLSANNPKTPEGWGALSALVNAHPDIQSAVLKINPNTDPPSPSKHTTYVPELPTFARLSAEALSVAETSGIWYRDAVKWCSERSPMTPPHFLQAGVVWLLGLAVARRVYVELHERIYPHLYALLVAETSKYAKSTGLNTIYSLVATTMPHMLIPGQTSPEGMTEILSGQQPSNYDKLPKREQELIEQGRRFSGQRGVLMDEYSGLLAASKKDYMAGFVELLMRLYDARDYEQYYTRSGGLLSIKSPGICILGATTPAAMARALSNEDWENGANARYLIMFRDEPLPYNPNYIAYLPPQNLLKTLTALHTNLPVMKDHLLNENADFEAWSASITPPALAAYQAYMKAVFYDLINDQLDERLHGNYRRLHIQALKMALAVACSDWAESGCRDKPVVTLGHWAIGQQIAEKGRESLHRMLPILSESRDSKTQRDLLVTLKQNPYGLSIRDIVRLVGRATKDVRSALEVLVESGEVEIHEHHPTGQGSKVTHLYRSVSAK